MESHYYINISCTTGTIIFSSAVLMSFQPLPVPDTTIAPSSTVLDAIITIAPPGVAPTETPGDYIRIMYLQSNVCN